jgi:hypothetical protein
MRYRVLQRREIREAVPVAAAFVILIVLGGMLAVGFGQPEVDTAALAGLAILGFLLLQPRVVRHNPSAASIVLRTVVSVLILCALLYLPSHAPLVLGMYGVMIVASGQFTTFDQRPHLIWLAIALALLAVTLFFAPIGGPDRADGLMIGVGAVIASAGAHWVSQRRRVNAYLAEELLRRERRELRVTVARLQAARQTIATLEGILPICTHCKRIRDANDEWVRIESFVEQRSAAQFSHGICPECIARYYPDLGGPGPDPT